VVEELRGEGIEVSFFVDPVLEQIEAASKLKAQIVELHTGLYCEARGSHESARELEKLKDAARGARALGLRVSAGHGLNYQNVSAVAAIEDVEELNIGHSIVARALLVGMEQAVREMISLIRR
jgi:pyridoxine 5-phosphate synthase